MPDQLQKKNCLSGEENGKYDNLRESLKQLVANQSVDSRLKSRFDVSDVIQNILVDLHEKGRLDDVLALPPEEQKKMLTKVATHDLCDEIKKQKRRKRDIRRERPLALGDESSASPLAQESRSAPVGLSFEDHSTPSEVAAKNEMKEVLQRALAQLPEKHRLAVVGFQIQALTHQQVADLNGWSLKKQYNYYRQGMDRIGELLRTAGGDS